MRPIYTEICKYPNGKLIEHIACCVVEEVIPLMYLFLNSCLVSELVKEPRASYEIWRFTTVFTRARVWSLSWGMYLASSYHNDLSSILTYPLIYGEISQVLLLFFRFSGYIFFVSSGRTTCNACLVILDLISLTKLARNAFTKFLIILFFCFCSVLLVLSPIKKCSSALCSETFSVSVFPLG